MLDYTKSITGPQINADEFIQARQKLGFGQSDLARAIGVPLRTLQDWEASKRTIPRLAQVALGLYIERDKWVITGIVSNAVEAAARECPGMFQ